LRKEELDGFHANAREHPDTNRDHPTAWAGESDISPTQTAKTKRNESEKKKIGCLADKDVVVDVGEEHAGDNYELYQREPNARAPSGQRWSNETRGLHSKRPKR